MNKASIEEQNVLIYDYFGNPQNIDSAYTDIKNWLKENKKSINGDVREEFVVSAADSQDTTSWHTKIYTPIK